MNIDRLEAAIAAPRGPSLQLPDTQVIDRPDWYQVVTPSTMSRNEVIFSRVEAADVERVIDEVVATYRAIGRKAKWCVGPWTTPADMGERLERRGFHKWDVRGMGRATSPPLSAPKEARVDPIEEPGLDRYLAVAMRGWSQPAAELATERAAHLELLQATPRVGHLFLASEGGVPRGTGALALRQGYAYLIGTQVLAEARGRGLYRALVAARLAFLARQGIGYAVTHAREATSAPILERLGFETLFRSACYQLDA